jgi:hypothetical protein
MPITPIAVGEFELTAGEHISDTNRIIAEVTCIGRPHIGYIPIVLIG